MLFDNPQIPIEELPSVKEVRFQRPAAAYIRVSYISTAIFLAFLLAGLAFLLLIPALRGVTVLGLGVFTLGLPALWLVLAVLGFWLTYRAFQIMGYALRERDIIFRKGVIFRSVTTIPFNRVQHCEVQQGPIERLFGLSSLEIFTAGGQSSDLKIPGLRMEQAEQMKAFIMGKTSATHAS